MNNSAIGNLGGTCKLPETVSVLGLIWACAVFSVIGMLNNLLIILVVWRNKTMHNPTNFLLANNAFTDFLYLISSTIMVSFVIYVDNTNEAFGISQMKKIYTLLVWLKTFIVGPLLISAVSLAVLAKERYNALVHPMKINRRLTKRAVKIVICLIWVLAMALSAPFCFKALNRTSRRYVLGTIILSGAISLFIIASCYGKIIYGIYVSKTIFGQISSAIMAQDIKDKKNIVKMLLANTLLFTVTRTPTLGYSLRLLSREKMTYGCLIYVSLFGHFSAFCNPLICIFFSENYRSAVKKMLTSCINRHRES